MDGDINGTSGATEAATPSARAHDAGDGGAVADPALSGATKTGRGSTAFPARVSGSRIAEAWHPGAPADGMT